MHKILYVLLILSFTSFAASNNIGLSEAPAAGTPVPAGSGASAALTAPGEAFAIDMAGGGVANIPEVPEDGALGEIRQLQKRILGDDKFRNFLAAAMVPTTKHMPREVIDALEWSLLVSVLEKMREENQIRMRDILNIFIPPNSSSTVDFIIELFILSVFYCPEFVEPIVAAGEVDEFTRSLDSFKKYVSEHRDLRQLLARLILHGPLPQRDVPSYVDSILEIPQGTVAAFLHAVLEKMASDQQITPEERAAIEAKFVRADPVPPTLRAIYGVFAGAVGAMVGAVNRVSGWFSSRATSTATPPSQPAP